MATKSDETDWKAIGAAVDKCMAAGRAFKQALDRQGPAHPDCKALADRHNSLIEQHNRALLAERAAANVGDDARVRQAFERQQSIWTQVERNDAAYRACIRRHGGSTAQYDAPWVALEKTQAALSAQAGRRR